MSKQNRKAPSRVRYEENHPTVSCRVTKEIYQQLQDIKQREKKSFADILKIGLGILQSDGEMEDKAYRRGFDKGYRKAEKEFKVTYACAVCGEAVELSSTQAKQAASKYMTEHNWGHAQCYEKKQ